MCLRQLEYTGVNDEGNLEALCPPQIKRWHDTSAIIPAKNHAWIHLIKDTDITFTMAVATTVCLNYPRKSFPDLGNRCWLIQSDTDHYSVLETALTWSGDDTNDPLHKAWTQNDLQGHKMNLRSRGILKIESVIAEKQVLVRWKKSIELSKGIRSMLVKDHKSTTYFEQMHRETQPCIYAFVLSDQVSRLKIPPEHMLLQQSENGHAGKKGHAQASPAGDNCHQESKLNKYDVAEMTCPAIGGPNEMIKSVSHAAKGKARLYPVNNVQGLAKSHHEDDTSYAMLNHTTEDAEASNYTEPNRAEVIPFGYRQPGYPNSVISELTGFRRP